MRILVALILGLVQECQTAVSDSIKEKYSVEVLNEGSGTEKPAKGTSIQMHYRGTFKDGSQFDASYDRGEPLAFSVGKGQVIQCWDEVGLEMVVGDKINVLCPYPTAYGDRAVGPIPAKSDLKFLMERMG